MSFFSTYKPVYNFDYDWNISYSLKSIFGNHYDLVSSVKSKLADYFDYDKDDRDDKDDKKHGKDKDDKHGKKRDDHDCDDKDDKHDKHDIEYEKQTVFKYNDVDPVHQNRAGQVHEVNSTYNVDTKELSFELVIEDITDSFTLAINDGPNPNSGPGEVALFFFDATNGTPVISVYGYNGDGVQGSWQDGDASQDGVQPADKIINSIANGEYFSDIVAVDNGDGTKTFSFKVDAEVIQNHDAEYATGDSWYGAGFAEKFGIWLHPSKDITTDYDSEGFLTQWYTPLRENQGWYDRPEVPTEECCLHIISKGDKKHDDYDKDDKHGKDKYDRDYDDRDDKDDKRGKDKYDRDDDKDDRDDKYHKRGKHKDDRDDKDDKKHGKDKDDHEDLYACEDAKDVFLYEVVPHEKVKIHGFDQSEGDVLDFSSIIEGYDPLQNDIDDFVQVKEKNGKTIVSVDADGSENGAHFQKVAVLKGVEDFDIDTGVIV